MLFPPLKHYLELFIIDTALKVSPSLHCFTTSISHGVENFFPRLWGTGISDAIFHYYISCNMSKYLPLYYMGNIQVIYWEHGDFSTQIIAVVPRLTGNNMRAIGNCQPVKGLLMISFKYIYREHEIALNSPSENSKCTCISVLSVFVCSFSG